nr:MAG TPA: hypothetical protein [Caudoviricetes sp.]
MSRIEELESERENLHLEQLKLQNKAKICEVRQLEISNEIRELKIKDDKEANTRICFEIDDTRIKLQKLCDKVLGESNVHVHVTLIPLKDNLKFQNYEFD